MISLDIDNDYKGEFILFNANKYTIKEAIYIINTEEVPPEQRLSDYTVRDAYVDEVYYHKFLDGWKFGASLKSENYYNEYTGEEMEEMKQSLTKAIVIKL